MPTASYRSFAGGELAPSLHARVDIAKYQTGLAACRNFLVRKSGGLTRRPGTEFIAETKHGDAHPVRLIPWHYSDAESAVLELGHQYMRVIKDGAYVTDASLTVTALNTNGRATVTARGLAMQLEDGNDVMVYDVGGVENVNGRAFKARMTAGEKNLGRIRLQTADGAALVPDGIYTGGGTIRRIMTKTLAHKIHYQGSELPDIRFNQTDDVMTLTHQNHAPIELTRTGDEPGDMTKWHVGVVGDGPSILGPLTVTSPGAMVTGAWIGNSRAQLMYAVTSVDADGRESLATYSGVIIEPPLSETTISSNASLSAGGSAIYSSYHTYNPATGKWDILVTASFDYGRKIVISPLFSSFTAEHAWRIEGTDSSGQKIVENVSVAANTIATGTSQVAYGRFITENYFKTVDSIGNGAAGNKWTGIKVGTVGRDMDFIPINIVDRNDSRAQYHRIYKASRGGLFGYIGQIDAASRQVGAFDRAADTPIDPAQLAARRRGR